MLSGDNGILQKATTAKENTDNSQIQERINLAYHSALVDGQGEVTEASLEEELKKEFNKGTLDENWLDKTSVQGKWKITIDGISLNVPAGIDVADNKVAIKAGTTNLKDVSNLSTLYGETTDYESVEGIEWQLFYDDDDYIYLIASDYVPGKTLPSELLTDGQYTTYCRKFANLDEGSYTGPIMENTPWSNGIESSTLAENTQTNNYLKWLKSSVVTKKNNPNMKAVAYMMDTNKWKNFAGNAKGATAIGGPTIEMFSLSYNKAHGTKIGTYEIVDSNNANQYGYMVKKEGSSWSNNFPALDSSSDSMWVKKETSKALAYWIASPSSYSDIHLLNIRDYEYGLALLDYFDVYYTSVGFRPLIAIPKSSLK